MARYYTNFGLNTVGVEAPDWSEPYNNASWPVRAVARSMGNHRLVKETNSSNHDGVWNNRWPVAAEQRILAKVSITAVSVAIAGRMAGASFSPTYVAATLHIPNQAIYLESQIGGTYAPLANTPMALATGVEYWIRLELVGTTARLRVWEVGTEEPGAWQLEYTTLAAGNQNSGRAGLATWGPGLARFSCDYFSLGTDGDEPIWPYRTGLDFRDTILAAAPRHYVPLDDAPGTVAPANIGSSGVAVTTSSGIASFGVLGAVGTGIETLAPLAGRWFFRIQDLLANTYTVHTLVRFPQGMTTSLASGSPGSSARILIYPTHGDSAFGSGMGVGLEIASNGIRIRQHTSGNINGGTVYTGFIAPDKWHLVTIRVYQSGSTRFVELYLDGMFCGHLPGTYSQVNYNTNVGTVLLYGEGAGSNTYGNSFHGMIDESVAFDRALTPVEIMDHWLALQEHLPVVEGDGAVQRLTPGSKLIGRFEYDNPEFPHSTVPWQGYGTKSILNNKFRVSIGSTPAWRGVPLNTADHSKALIYSRMRSTGGTWSGLSAHGDLAGNNLTRAGFSYQRSPAEILAGLARVLNQVEVGFTDVSATTQQRTYGIDYSYSLFTDEEWHETRQLFRPAEQTTTGTAPPDAIIGGKVGFVITTNIVLEAAYFIAALDRYVTIQGVPVGGTVELRESQHSNLILSAPEVGGVATLDMFDVPLERADRLYIRDALGDVVATYSEPGQIVEPGETYEVTGMGNPPSTPGAFVLPELNGLYLGEVPVNHAGSVHPDGEGVEYRYEYQLGVGGWQLLQDWGTEMLALWVLPPDFPLGVEYKLRVAARGDVTRVRSAWVESPVFGIRGNTGPGDPVFLEPTAPPKTRYDRYVRIELAPLADPEGDEPVLVEIYYIEADGTHTTIFPWGPWQEEWIWDAGETLTPTLNGRFAALAVDSLGEFSDLVISDPFILRQQRPDHPYEYQHEFASLDAELDGTSITDRPDAISLDHFTVFSPGPVAISDTSEGLVHKAWRCHYDGLHFHVSGALPDGSDWGSSVQFNGMPGVKEFDWCFTQNADVLIAAEIAGEIWVRWFDPLVGYTWENFGPGRTPRVILDDPVNTQDSDVQVFYLHDGDDVMYHRRQRDRYDIAYAAPLTNVADLFLEDVVRGRDRRVHVIYAERDPLLGRYEFYVLSTNPFAVPGESEKVELWAALLNGTFDEVVFTQFPLESLDLYGGLLSGMINFVVLDTPMEIGEIELAGSLQGGSLDDVVVIVPEIATEIEPEEVDLWAALLSGELDRRVFTPGMAPQEFDLYGALLGGTLEVV